MRAILCQKPLLYPHLLHSEVNMISLFGKSEKIEKEPSLLNRLKASVTRTKEALSETVDRFVENPVMAKFVWATLPGAQQITKQFLANEYECHHNAARDIRKIVQAVDVAAVLAKLGQETAYTKYLLRRWDRLTFSAKA